MEKSVIGDLGCYKFSHKLVLLVPGELPQWAWEQGWMFPKKICLLSGEEVSVHDPHVYFRISQAGGAVPWIPTVASIFGETVLTKTHKY